jgi:hypothetical protein
MMSRPDQIPPAGREQGHEERMDEHVTRRAETGPTAPYARPSAPPRPTRALFEGPAREEAELLEYLDGADADRQRGRPLMGRGWPDVSAADRPGPVPRR